MQINSWINGASNATLTRSKGFLRHLLRDEHGAALLELTFIFTLIMALVFGIIDCGRLLWAVNTIYFAVHQAARCASVDKINCGTVAKIQTYAVSQTLVMTVLASDFIVTTPSCGNNISFIYAFSPLYIPYTFNVTIVACMPKNL
jgi:Flp pilus assembly pilin Flp